MAYSKIRPRRSTYYEFTTVNPVLDEGELVVEVPDTGVGTGLCKFKIGDGVSKYKVLPYAFDGAAASSINGGTATSYHIIQLRSDTYANWTTANPIISTNEIVYDSTNCALKVGDGVTKWSVLPYLNSAGDIATADDYGEESDS